MTRRRMLSVVAGISLVYDLAIGFGLLVAADSIASWFRMPVPDPRLFVTLLALFLIAVGLGYLQPMRDPERHRAYLWIFGPLLKGAGAATFLVSYWAGESPQSYLLFAASDVSLGTLTLVALLRKA